MNLFLASLLILTVLGFGLYAFTRIPPATLAGGIRAFTTTLAALAGTGLLLTGRLGLAIMVACAAVVALRALRSGGGSAGSTSQRWWSAGSASASGPDAPGRTSAITTDMLAMTLDHQSGDLDGDVLSGRFAGRSLGSLGLKDLLQLLADCRRDDPRSTPLLETYLDRHQPEWREQAGAAHSSDAHDRGRPSSDGMMDEATARSILDVSPTASAEEIKEAHRRLMNKLHPDHGGSSYLAAQLNQAKDVLLGS